MIVCVCKGISDRQIREAAADGARNVKALSRALGVSTQCGKCASYARDVLDEYHGRSDLASVVGYFAPQATPA